MLFKATSPLLIIPHIVAIELYCPDPKCNQEGPIPDPTGRAWRTRPHLVTCPQCGQTFRVSLKNR